MRRKLGEILVSSGFVTNEDIHLALTDQSAGEPARLGDLLVALGKITPLQLARALSIQYAIPYLDLPVVPQSVMDAVPLDFQRQYRFLPIKVEPGVITIAMADLSQLVTDVLPTLKRQHPSVKVFVAAGDEIDAVHAALSGQYDTAPASSLPAIAPAIAPVSASGPASELDLFASFELDPPPPGPAPGDDLDVDVSTSGLLAAPRSPRPEEEEPTFFEASLAPLAPSSPSPAPPSIAPVIPAVPAIAPVAPAIPSIAPVVARPPTGKVGTPARPPSGKLPAVPEQSARPATGKLAVPPPPVVEVAAPPPPAVRPVTGRLPPLPPVTHGAPPPPPNELPVPRLLPPPPPVGSSPSFPDLLEGQAEPEVATPSMITVSESAVSVSESSAVLSPSSVFEFDAPPPPPGQAVVESAVDDFFAAPLGDPAPVRAESFEVTDVEVEPAPASSFELGALDVEPMPEGQRAAAETFEVGTLEVEPMPEGDLAPAEIFEVGALEVQREPESAQPAIAAPPEDDLPFFESSSPSQAVAQVVDDAFVPGVPSSSPSSLAQLMIEPEAPMAPIVAPMPSFELPAVAPVIAAIPPPPAIRSALVPPPPPAPTVPPPVETVLEASVEPEPPVGEIAPAAELPDWLRGSTTQEVAEVGWTGALDHLAPSKLILAVTRALIRRGVISERDILDAVDKKK